MRFCCHCKLSLDLYPSPVHGICAECLPKSDLAVVLDRADEYEDEDEEEGEL